MKSLDRLSRIGITEQVRAVVATMRSLSAMSLHHYEEAAPTLDAYVGTIEPGL